MTDGSSNNSLFPEVGDTTQLYLNFRQSQKTEQANQALKLLQINLFIASILVAAPILFQLRNLNQFEVVILNLYSLAGTIFWLLSVGAATSAFISSRASMNPEITVFENYLHGELDDGEFRQFLSDASIQSKQTSGECFWLLTMSTGFAILAVGSFGLSILDSVASISIAYIQGLWPLLGLILIVFLPSVILGVIARFWPKYVHMTFPPANLRKTRWE